MKPYIRPLIKIGLALASFLAFAYLATWQFSILLLVMIGIHERGHIWAAGKYGAKSGGFYFLPFLGGAATIDLGGLPSRWSEYFVAIMGPIWGFALALVWAGIYWATNDPLWAFAAYWGAFFNLFNLVLPVYPADGGRIVKSWLSSINPWLGLYFSLFGIVLSLGLYFLTGHFIFIFLALLAYQDYAVTKKNETFILKEELPKEIQAWKAELAEFEKTMPEPPIGEDFHTKLRNMVDRAISQNRDKLSPEESEWLKIQNSIKEKEEFLAKILKTPDIQAMNFGEFCLSFTCFIISAAAMVLLMVYMYQIPGWETGMAELFGRIVK